MCGIGGIFIPSGKAIKADLLLKMNQQIRHRGPDDEGLLMINTTDGRLRNVFQFCG